MGLVVRDSGPADAEAIVRLHVACFRVNFKGLMEQAAIDAIDEKEWFERRKEILTRPERIKLVAESGGKVVGFCDGGATRDQHYNDCGELYALYVDPGHQAGGVGKALVTEMKARLKAAGYSRMMVKTWASNPPARRFYASLGGVNRGAASFFYEGQWYPDAVFVYELD